METRLAHLFERVNLKAVVLHYWFDLGGELAQTLAGLLMIGTMNKD